MTLLESDSFSLRRKRSNDPRRDIKVRRHRESKQLPVEA